MSQGGELPRVRLGVLAWAAVMIGTATVAAIAVVAVGALSFLRSRDDAERRIDHDAWTAQWSHELGDQVAVTDDAVRDAMVRTRVLAPGSVEYDHAVLAVAATAAGPTMLPMRVLGSARSDGSFDGVVMSEEASDIGRLRGTPEAWTVTGWSRPDQQLVLPSRPVLTEDWYRLAQTGPGAVHHSGPGRGQAGEVVFGTSVTGGVDGSVWLGAISVDDYSDAVTKLFGNESIHRSATLLRTGDELEVLGAVDGSPVGPMRHVATEAADDPDGRATRTVDTDDGSWVVTVGQVFDDEPDLLWAAATRLPAPVGPPARFTTVALAAVATALTIGLLIAWFVLARPARRLQTLTDVDATGRLRVRSAESRVTEFNQLVTRARAQIGRVNDTVTELEDGEQELRDILVGVVHQRSEQRRWYATRLHDGPLQDLVAAQLAAEAGIATDPELLRGANAKLRRIIAELTFDQHGATALDAALVDLAEMMTEEGSFAVHATTTGEIECDDRTSEVVLRTARELLTNSRKHSRGTRADVRLAFEPGRLRLVVSDDGVGYPPELSSAGFGLRSISVEIAALGGTITRESDAGARTVVTVPLPARAGEPSGHRPQEQGSGH